ncbi:hypothetical protein AZI86_07130 [Bdellovibrio bacteriovorus]|uniref:IrrE N-terminal-like domain-containing protein n=1 Tax=Bdellovibrio bacteriovorus TaxID=959 RepID=A0A150WQN0_BDEBC|nr:ImmA/IrrE family metallo-endopeptidase [Bdellovibrio bacteriovorus]KYG66803.1 hypothetical protein AZI86_07130 [Bdellovibrio bacteriovorus]
MKVFQVDPRSKATLEASALETLEEFNRGLLKRPQPLDIEKLVEFYMPQSFGWHLDPQETLHPGVEGYCDPKTKTLVIPEITLESLSSDGRSRFTVAHEFAHVKEHREQMKERMLEYDENSERLYRRSRSEIVVYRDPEWQANFLGGALLMPEVHVIEMLHAARGPSSRLAQRMAMIFNVSLQAATVRMNAVWKSHFE